MSKANYAVTDEQIVAALIGSKTIAEAAQKIGLNPRAVYKRMGDENFQEIYQWANSDIVRCAVSELNAHVTNAIAVVAEIMGDKGTNAAVRLQAAQTILNTAVKFSERLGAVEAKAENAIWQEAF